MSKERNKSVPAAYLILRKEDKILLIRRKNTSYYDGWYMFPAGHVDLGELPSAAAVREAKEEIGVTIDQKDVDLVHSLYRTAHDITGDRADYFFVANNWEGEPANMEPDKCDDVQWFSVKNLPENIIPYIKDVIVNIENNIMYSEVDAGHTVPNPTK